MQESNISIPRLTLMIALACIIGLAFQCTYRCDQAVADEGNKQLAIGTQAKKKTISKKGVTASCTSGTISFNSKTSTLTAKNTKNLTFVANKNMTLKLVGKNTTSKSLASNKSLTITGKGSLTSTYKPRRSVPDGLMVSKNMKVKSGTIKAASPIDVGGNLTFAKGKINLTGKDAYLYADGDFKMTSGNISIQNSNSRYPMSVDSFKMSGGSLKIANSKSKYGSLFVGHATTKNNGDFVLTGGSVAIDKSAGTALVCQCHLGDNEKKYGGNVRVGGGTLSITSCGASECVYVHSDVILDKGSVKVERTADALARGGYAFHVLGKFERKPTCSFTTNGEIYERNMW